MDTPPRSAALVILTTLFGLIGSPFAIFAIPVAIGGSMTLIVGFLAKALGPRTTERP